MSVAPAPRALDTVVPGLAAATVVAFAAGSSSVGAVKEPALDLRWAVLLALAVAAAVWARGTRPPAVPALAAAAFVALALVSAAWSVAPRLTAGRGLSVALLFAAALALAAAARRSPPHAERVLAGLLAGAAAVALLGIVVLAASYGTAVTPASIESPARFRGFGENPNTVPLLLAVALPLAVGFAARARGRARWAALGVLALFAATIVGSGSRGALAAGAFGVAVQLLLGARGRRRAVALALLVAAAAGAAALQSLPRESQTPPPPPPPAAAPSPPARYVDVERAYPLDNDVGRPLPGGGEPPVERSLLGSSGRAEAWRGALDRAAGRPLLGFGFGTEARAFVDRYYGFVGGLPESSYLGIALQLGLAGAAALLGLVTVLLVAGRRALLREGWGAACAGVVAAGLAAAVVQSYLYSAGNIAAATFWIAAFLPASASERPG